MNNDIQEAYCSFEVSKLLQEKGFDVPLNTWYDSNAKEGFAGMKGRFNIYCARPIHALAIEWIRVNFGIHVQTYKPFHKNYWVVDKIPVEFRVEGHEDSPSWGKPMSYGTLKGKFNSPQEATEAALLYVLKNLIQ